MEILLDNAKSYVITIPYKILKQMPYHQARVSTLEEFDKAWDEFKEAEKKSWNFKKSFY